MRRTKCSVVVLFACILTGCASHSQGGANQGEPQDKSADSTRAAAAAAPAPSLVDAAAIGVSVSPELRTSKKPEKELTQKQREEIRNEIDKMINFCQPKLVAFENTSRTDAQKALVVSLIGLTSGAVIAPALTAANASANAGWIAAFSGLGGATNFAGEAIKSAGFNGAFAADDRNKAIEGIKRQLARVFDGSLGADERITAIIAAKTECVFYAISSPATANAPAK